MIRLNWFQKVVFSINAVIAILLGVIINLSESPPSVSGYLYLLPLGFPLILIANIGFALWWMISKKLHFILSITVIWFATPLTGQWMSFNISSGTSAPHDVKLMTFNARRFNQFNWIKERNITQEIMAYIESEKPDIITFQEFINNPKKNEYQIKLLKKLGYKYFKLEPRGKQSLTRQYFGLATFSKFPITHIEAGYNYKKGKKSIKCAYIITTIKFKTKSVEIVNSHLRSLHFGKDDYEFVENVSESPEQAAIHKSKSILSKVLHAGKERELEVMHLYARINASEYPLILTGDFNEPPTSFAYSKLKQVLSDPFSNFGFGPQPTFDGISTIPGLRLDHILHNQKIITTTYKTGPYNLSDHRPVITTFHFTE